MAAATWRSETPCCSSATDSRACLRKIWTLPFTHRPRSRSLAVRAIGGSQDNKQGKRVVVIGGGFAGFGAAKHLAEQGLDVTLIDGSDQPGGLSAGWRTPQGRAVEAGIKGFWYQYHNIFKLVRELGGDWPFTQWTTSGFWSPSGLTTEAPIFSSKLRLPALIGQFVHTAPLFWRLPLEERATMLPWLWSVLDVNASPEVYARYDRMTAKELFDRFGVSERMYKEFIRPTLLVGLFAEPEDLSAAAVINTLYFYAIMSQGLKSTREQPQEISYLPEYCLLAAALAHQADFDVCWCKGSVSERIFLPLVERIKSLGTTVVGSTFATDIEVDETTGKVQRVLTRDKSGKTTAVPADAVVFAIGITGMQKIVEKSAQLSQRQEFRDVAQLKAIDVISARLWLDRRIDFRYPANVLAGFEGHAGSTFFDLNTLQDEYRDEGGSVIGSDFYGATELLGLSDEEIISKVMKNVTRCEPALKGAKVLDSAVLKFPKAVTHFSPGSHEFMPEQQTSFKNVFIAGDWVKNIGHGANGLSQERAFVTGLRAANMVIDELGHGQQADILPVEPDEPHIAFGKAANGFLRASLTAVGLDTRVLP